jgi:hypothetical protein
VHPRPTSPEDHQGQAQRNARLARALAGTTDRTAHQWSAIVAFYAAIHWVDADIMRRANSRPVDHEERNRIVSSSYSAIDNPYRRLYQRSRALRSDCDETRPEELPTLLESLDTIRRHFHPDPPSPSRTDRG